MNKKQEVATDQLSVKRIVTDGSILSVVGGSIIMAVVYYNTSRNWKRS